MSLGSFLVGLWIGAPAGMLVMAWLVAGKRADEQAQRAHTLRSVIIYEPPPHMDDGRRLLVEIAEEAERAALWAETHGGAESRGAGR